MSPHHSFLSLAGPQTALQSLAVLLQTLGCCLNQQGVAPHDTSIWTTPPSYSCRPKAVAGKEFPLQNILKDPDLHYNKFDIAGKITSVSRSDGI